MADESPYHAGERAVQDRVGERATADRNGRVISSRIPPGAIPFLAQQRMLVVGSVDRAGTPWASVLTGRAGFICALDDGGAIELDLDAADIADAEIFWSNITRDPRVGALAIELSTRRRLRVNGTVASRTAERMRLTVEEAYPNCPKYIQRRHLRATTSGESIDEALQVDDTLTGDQLRLIERADTFFIATVNDDASVDASHRGGPPGFVRMRDRRTLRIPDYVGNSMFNTLGNISRSPSAGVVFIEFDTGVVLQVVGRARIEFDAEDPENLTAGTRRFWTLEVDAVRGWRQRVRLEWEFLDASPFNPTPRASAVGGGAQ